MSDRADEPESLGKRMQRLRGEARLAAIGEIVSQWRESGSSHAVFCREVGIARVTLGRWLRQLEMVKAPSSTEPVLLELGVHEVASEDAYEVVLADGIWLRVPAGFRDGDLARLLGVLSSAC